MGVKTEHLAADECGRAHLDAAGHAVAVLHGEGEIPLLQRRAHALVFAFGNETRQHQPLGARLTPE